MFKLASNHEASPFRQGILRNFSPTQFYEFGCNIKILLGNVGILHPWFQVHPHFAKKTIFFPNKSFFGPIMQSLELVQT